MQRPMLLLVLLSLFLLPAPAHAASLSVAPTTGVFTLGATFTATVTINTGGKPANTFEVFLKFPADKLQIVSPSTGESIASVWVGQPKFDNRTGTVELRGGIPGGIITERGVIATIRFRAKGVGDAFLKIDDNSKVLANDGLATNILQSTAGAMFKIVLPPPAGPLVISPTHNDQERWYTESQATFSWENEPATAGYSYALSQNPIEVPDNISEGARTTITYNDLASGNWYFHVKALRDGLWGGVSHFGAHIDHDPPAEFSVDIVPGAWTTQTQPVIQFFSTDSLSGIDHFEIQIVPLNQTRDSSEFLFVEAASPYVASALETGPYDIIVRAYDKAGNYLSSTKHLQVLQGMGRLLNDRGIVLDNSFVIPWMWLLIVGALVVLVVAWAVHRAKRHHERTHTVSPEEMLSAEVKAQLKELKMYRRKYSKALLIFLAVLASFLVGKGTFAAESLSPPLITSISENISNQEIFYVGGKTLPESKVLLHLQNTATGEITSQETTSDRNGDWFYRHSGFLRTGEYILWAQVSVGEEISPPSPQASMGVEPAAFEFGSSRLSYALIYLTATIFLAFCITILLVVLGRYVAGIRKKRQKLLADVRMIEEKIRIGFAILRKDVEAELALLNRKDGAGLLPEEKLRAEELQRDIEKISAHIGEEIWELEKDAVA